MSFSISATLRIWSKYRRRVGLFAASMFINALVLLSILSLTDSRGPQFQPVNFDVIEIEFVDEIIEAPSDEPQIEIKPENHEEEAPLKEEIPQLEREATQEPVQELTEPTEEVVEPETDEEIEEKKIELAISPRWQVDRSGLTLEEQSTGVFLPNDGVGSGVDGEVAKIRRALNMAACLDIETARRAGAACAELGAIARYATNNPLQQRVISNFANQFKRSQAVPFIEKQGFDPSKGPLPEGMASSDSRSRGGGVSTSALPDPHPHAYDEVTRGN